MPGGEVPSKPVVVMAHDHSMGDSLPRYVESRVHEWVDDTSVSRIVVLGSYDRSLCISSKEKRDKLENWQRPTACRTGGTLELHCFPGRAYVFHYASLVATYLDLCGRDPTIVDLRLPDAASCADQLLATGLADVSPTSAVVVASGNVFLQPEGAQWVDHGECLSRVEVVGGEPVTWLAIKHTFWGDIAFHLGRLLAERGFPQIVFVGKLGSLVPDHVPNETIASGCTSLVGGTEIRWVNLFDGHVQIESGRHVTLPSVLQETNGWVAERTPEYQYVDPEVGNLAAGTLDGGAAFSFLHIVSDNLSQRYAADLSNEREEFVRKRREATYHRLGGLLREALAGRSST